MNSRSISIMIGMLFFFVSFTQGQLIKKDTSYTVNSAFLKYIKKFPNISIAQADTSGISIQKNVIYKKVNGRNLSLDIYNPKYDSSKYPAIFMIHGGGWKSGDKTHMLALSSALSSHGYLAIAMEYRLAPEAPYPAGILDIEGVIKWAINQADILQIDTSNLVLLGCSSGAQMASLIGMTASERDLNIKAVVNLDGILAFHHPESKEGKSAALWLGGSYEEATENWEAASPLTYKGKDDPPILFINSQYPRFHAGRDEVIEILKKEGIYTAVHEFPDSPHTFWLFDPWFDPTLVFIVNFLNKTLSE